MNHNKVDNKEINTVKGLLMFIAKNGGEYSALCERTYLLIESLENENRELKNQHERRVPKRPFCPGK